MIRNIAITTTWLIVKTAFLFAYLFLAVCSFWLVETIAWFIGDIPFGWLYKKAWESWKTIDVILELRK